MRESMDRSARYNPSKTPLIIAAILVAGVFVVLWRMEVHPLYAYLLGVSIVTFLFYGYDKRQSLKNKWRVPEAVLHILALSGGTPGALIGQALFRHKTRKLRFKILFAAIILLQVLLVYLYWIKKG